MPRKKTHGAALVAAFTERVRKSGGRRTSVTLTARAVQALDVVREHTDARSDSAAICVALERAAAAIQASVDLSALVQLPKGKS